MRRPSGYTPSPSNGTVRVEGRAWNEVISFAPSPRSVAPGLDSLQEAILVGSLASAGATGLTLAILFQRRRLAP
ncbi:MAG TPA: hypothetical protein VML94_03280 [Thermoplasmata archaeon]|nr:hypothetical protein [Thermoplasmata archaeon]